MRGDFVQEQFTRGNYPTESSHRRSYIPTGTSHQGNYDSQRCHTKKRNHIPCGHPKVIMSHRGSARGAMFHRGHTKRTIPRRCITDTGNYIPRRSRRGNYPTQTSDREIRQKELYIPQLSLHRESYPPETSHKENDIPQSVHSYLYRPAFSADGVSSSAFLNSTTSTAVSAIKS